MLGDGALAYRTHSGATLRTALVELVKIFELVAAVGLWFVANFFVAQGPLPSGLACLDVLRELWAANSAAVVVVKVMGGDGDGGDDSGGDVTAGQT